MSNDMNLKVVLDAQTGGFSKGMKSMQQGLSASGKYGQNGIRCDWCCGCCGGCNDSHIIHHQGDQAIHRVRGDDD